MEDRGDQKLSLALRENGFLLRIYQAYRGDFNLMYAPEHQLETSFQRLEARMGVPFITLNNCRSSEEQLIHKSCVVREGLGLVLNPNQHSEWAASALWGDSPAVIIIHARTGVICTMNIMWQKSRTIIAETFAAFRSKAEAADSRPFKYEHVWAIMSPGATAATLEGVKDGHKQIIEYALDTGHALQPYKPGKYVLTGINLAGFAYRLLCRKGVPAAQILMDRRDAALFSPDQSRNQHDLATGILAARVWHC